MATFAATMAR